MYPPILKKAFIWAQMHGYCGVDFVEEGEHTWVFLRCWDSSQFRRVCVAVLDRFSGNVSEEEVAPGRIIDAIEPDVRVVSVQGGPHALVEAYVNFLGSGCQQKLNEYPLFGLRLFKRCLQKTASSVFGTLNPYSMTEFIVNRLKGGGESGLDGFWTGAEEGHLNQQSHDARTRWCGGQYCGSVALDRCVSEGNRVKRRRW